MNANARTMLAAALGSLGLCAPARARAETPAPFCPGTYADDFAALSAQSRERDRGPEGTFSYCTRNTAVYECVSYGADGTLRRSRERAVLHGTAFAYTRRGGETFLLTNDHVAAWPAVTSDDHAVSGIPSGCKKVSESLVLVDDESDGYARDDIPVTRVVTDPRLDVAVLKTRASLQVMPWKIGHDAALQERNLVQVRGFPLGAFRATNIGKVISAHDHDDYGDWDHDDFVVDALLSSGNSGSPVLAISCATGEYELVGVYHAGYTAGSALNVVVGIDQVRDLMTTFKKTPGARKNEGIPGDRSGLEAALGAGREMFFPFGSLVAEARGRADGSLLFVVFPKSFPFAAEPVLVAEDLAPRREGDFGQPGRTWLGSSRGLRGLDPAGLDADAQAELGALLDSLRADATATALYRTADQRGSTSRQSSDSTSRMSKALSRVAASRADLVRQLTDLAERLGPQPGETGARLADILAAPAAAPSTTTTSTMAKNVP